MLDSGVVKEALLGPPGLHKWQDSNMGSLRQQASINTFQAVYKYSGAGDSSAAVFAGSSLFFLSFVYIYLHTIVHFLLFIYTWLFWACAREIYVPHIFFL